MNRSLIAAFASGLVFPGAGQLFLRRPKRACLFLIPAAIAVTVFVSGLLARISVLADQVQAGTLALDPVAIAAQLEQQDSSVAGQVSAAVMVVCWIASIVDAWWCGREAL